MNLLLTSIGKRIELIEHLKSRFRIIGADASTENAAKYFTDVFYQIPRCSEENYVDKLLTICKKEEVSLLVPLYEPEFMILDGARERFREAGVTLVLSDKAVLDICDDKRKTAVFFEKYDIPAPKTFSAQEVEDIIGGRTAAYPLIVKPVDGMGSENIFMAGDRRELAFFYGYVNNALVQERASGTEYTIDVLCNFSGEPVYLVPRVRLEVRAGEVTKSRVDPDALVEKETERLLAALRREGGVRGPMTIQCFLAEDKKSLQFLEINPRFGGGVPLAFAAGADYASALSEMAAGKGTDGEAEKDFPGKEIKKLTMLRYTQAVYVE
ncbi:MAG: ATP-grasp domain-containing protein [Lachnospiraceae bacterium]|jgi:carbamoyl-phosphate synthase large subunit|nr:ATP-grasp domain-containing protein [Lachnospiraceae bacterium]